MSLHCPKMWSVTNGDVIRVVFTSTMSQKEVSKANRQFEMSINTTISVCSLSGVFVNPTNWCKLTTFFLMTFQSDSYSPLFFKQCGVNIVEVNTP